MFTLIKQGLPRPWAVPLVPLGSARPGAIGSRVRRAWGVGPTLFT
jgi:hypothetical protein